MCLLVLIIVKHIIVGVLLVLQVVMNEKNAESIMMIVLIIEKGKMSKNRIA